MPRTLVQKMADRQERRGAAAYGGRTTSRSGAGWSDKADVHTEDEVIEMKATGKTQISIKASWLEKVFVEATAKLKRPVLEFELNGKQYVTLPREEYISLRDTERAARQAAS